MTLYKGVALRNDVGGAEILARCLVRSWEPTKGSDETCRVCGHKHIELCYEIYDPTSGLVVYPVGSECIFTYTENTPIDRANARKQKRDAEKARAREAYARKAELMAELVRKAILWDKQRKEERRNKALADAEIRRQQHHDHGCNY